MNSQRILKETRPASFPPNSNLPASAGIENSRVKTASDSLISLRVAKKDDGRSFGYSYTRRYFIHSHLVSFAFFPLFFAFFFLPSSLSSS